MASASFDHHEECPRCGSKDNVACYLSDDFPGEYTKFCFTSGCGYTITDKDLREGKTTMSEFIDVPMEGRRTPKAFRGISPATYEAFGVFAYDDCLYFPYYDAVGKLTGYKVRDFRKEKNEKYHFTVLGDITSKFFGTRSSSYKSVIITTGEFDALAGHEAFEGKYFTFLSVPTGDGSATKTFKKNVALLDSCVGVYLAFDNDPSGDDTLQDVREIRPDAKVISSPVHKDVNDWVLADPEQFKQTVWAAKNQTPSFITSGAKELLDLLDSDNHDIISTGIRGLDSLLDGGLAQHEITAIMASPGSGKTTTVGTIVSAALKQGKKVLISPTEESHARYLANILRAVTGTHPKDVPRADRERFVSQFADQLFFFDFEQRPDNAAFETILRQAVIAQEIDLFIIDTISNDVGNEDSDIASRMRSVNAVTRKQPIHTIIVTHTNRAGQDKDEEGNEVVPLMRHAFGASAIERLTWNFIALQRLDGGNTALHVMKSRRCGRDALDHFLLKYNAKHNSYEDTQHDAGLSRLGSVPREQEPVAPATDILVEVAPVHVGAPSTGANQYTYFPSPAAEASISPSTEKFIGIFTGEAGDLSLGEQMPESPATWTRPQVFDLLKRTNELNGRYVFRDTTMRPANLGKLSEVVTTRTKDGYSVLCHRDNVKQVGKLYLEEARPLLYDFSKDNAGYTNAQMPQQEVERVRLAIRDAGSTAEPDREEYQGEVQVGKDRDVHTGLGDTEGQGLCRDEGSNGCSLEGENSEGVRPEPRTESSVHDTSDESQRANKQGQLDNSRDVVRPAQDTLVRRRANTLLSPTRKVRPL